MAYCRQRDNLRRTRRREQQYLYKKTLKGTGYGTVRALKKVQLYLVQVNFVVKELAGFENNFAGLAPRLFSPIRLKIPTNGYRNGTAPHIVTWNKRPWPLVSVVDPDPGSGAFLTLDSDPGSGIGFFPDPGSRIPTPYFLELSDKLGKKFYNSLKTGQIFFFRI